jgi:hypothetical protein
VTYWVSIYLFDSKPDVLELSSWGSGHRESVKLCSCGPKRYEDVLTVEIWGDEGAWSMYHQVTLALILRCKLEKHEVGAAAYKYIRMYLSLGQY